MDSYENRVFARDRVSLWKRRLHDFSQRDFHVWFSFFSIYRRFNIKLFTLPDVDILIWLYKNAGLLFYFLIDMYLGYFFRDWQSLSEISYQKFWF